MKTQNEKRISSQTRTARIAKKIDQANRMMITAKRGLSNANKNLPFTSKSEAMKRINEIRKWQKQLSNIWCLEFSLV